LFEFLPIILICSINLSPDKCNQETAETRFSAEPKRSPIACIMEGQSKLAQAAFAPKEGEPYYVKVKCVPREIK